MSPHLPVRNPQWFEDANCLGVNPNEFYPEDGYYEVALFTREQVEALRLVCLHCPVRRDCLHAAINEHEEGPYNDIADHGFRGGMTPNERKQYVRAYWRTEGVN